MDDSSQSTCSMYRSDLLAGRFVFITGGGTGLGLSMAQRMAALGAKVFLVGRRVDPLQQACAEIRGAGGTCGFVQCDIREPESVAAALRDAEKQLGPVDTLINNAAGNFLSRTEKLSPKGFAAIVDLALKGTFHCTLALGQRWIADQRTGVILNMVATYAQNGSAYVVPSACAKAGVLAMTRSLAVEWSRFGIRVNAIAPGPFPTESSWSQLVSSPRDEEQLRRAHPMKRFGRPDELADLAVYMISPQSEYINGECVVIDGGRWLKGAGSFNHLSELTESEWEAREARRRPRT
jgi:NAD(P)-dependent dehydrogenase (short-subunit alcohol dehydrogenase family)